MKKIVLLAFVLVFLSTAVVVEFIRPVVADGTIYIRANGSIEGTTHISSADNITYTFTDNIYGEIVVERDNIVVDGAGYTLQGTDPLGGEKGIALSDRNNITIKNVEIKGLSSGIWLSGSSNITISGNDITANHWNGISLDYSSGNSISGNNITENKVFGSCGIKISSSSNNNISGNDITNNYFGINLRDSPNNGISGNNITNNEDSIWLDWSSNNGISRNIITNNGHGIYLCDSNYNTISGNIITNNDYYGIWLRDFSNYNRISGNIITINNRGIRLYESSNNTISGNNIAANIWYGVWFDHSSNNVIYHNNLVDNSNQVHSYNSTNVWDDGAGKGNYWSDYEERYPNAEEIDDSGIWDTPYVIDLDNIDHYPLMPPPSDTTPPTLSILSPENKTYTVNDVPLTFTVSESTSWIGYSPDGQANVTITGNTTLSGLSDGSHSLIVYAKDTAGNTGASEIIYFTIETKKEEAFPVWIIPAIVIIAVVGTALLVYFAKVKKTTEKVK